jgi:hypothetical protein
VRLLDTLVFLSIQPILSPSYPVPLPDRLSSPEEMTLPDPPLNGPQLPFFPEKLEFAIKWGVVNAGTATLSIDQVVSLARPSLVGGESARPRKAYRITSTARSKGVTSAVYPVKDLNESWMDVESLTSLAFMKKLREGTFFRDEWYRYFPDQNRFVSEKVFKDGAREHNQGVIPTNVQDILSAMYFVRTQPLEIGKDVIVDVNTGQNWPLVVHVLRREMVDTPSGKFDAFVVEPELRAEGLFIQKGKKLTMWLTADKWKTPVRVDVEVFIGHISARLTHFERPK